MFQVALWRMALPHCFPLSELQGIGILWSAGEGVQVAKGGTGVRDGNKWWDPGTGSNFEMYDKEFRRRGKRRKKGVQDSHLEKARGGSGSNLGFHSKASQWRDKRVGHMV